MALLLKLRNFNLSVVLNLLCEMRTRNYCNITSFNSDVKMNLEDVGKILV